MYTNCVPRTRENYLARRTESKELSPRTDILEGKDEIRLVVELPGLDKSEIDINFGGERVLSIKGTKKRENKDELTFLKSEIKYGEFSRSFILSEDLDEDSIEANFKYGILELTIKKKEEAKPKEINVTIN